MAYAITFDETNEKENEMKDTTNNTNVYKGMSNEQIEWTMRTLLKVISDESAKGNSITGLLEPLNEIHQEMMKRGMDFSELVD